MDVEEALHRVSPIHRGFGRGQFFHGYRAIPTFFSGVMAFIACAVHGIWISDSRFACLILWICAAAISLAVVATEMFLRYRRCNSTLERDLIIGAAEQFIPTIAAGALLTLVLGLSGPDKPLWLLPGLWAIMLSLGIFASRRMLPPALKIVGAHYLITGLLCIALGDHNDPFFPAWTMAITFGVGQILAAAVLWIFLQRSDSPHHADDAAVAE
jgi:hypothetical protein